MMFNRIMTWVVTAILLINMTLFLVTHILPVNVDGNVSKEMPLQFFDDRVYWTKLSDYTVCGDDLYLLYGYKKVLSIYDLDGHYLHSYLLEAPSKGEFELHTDGDSLYLESTDHNLYEFVDGNFIQYLDRDLDASQIKQIRKSFKVDSQEFHSNTYELRGASVWRIDQNMTATEVVHRSPLLTVFQYDIVFWIIHLLCILGLIFLSWGKNTADIRQTNY